MSIEDMRENNRKRSGPVGWAAADEQTLRDMVAEGHSASVIGERIGKTRNAVIGKAARIGVQLNGSKQRYWANERLKALVVEYKNGRSKSEIIEMLGGSERTLKDAITAIRAEGIRAPAPRAESVRRTNFNTFVKRNKPRDPNPVEPSGDCAVLLMDLASHHCRWPVGEAIGPGQLFCGWNNEGIGSYCNFHWRKSIGGTREVA